MPLFLFLFFSINLSFEIESNFYIAKESLSLFTSGFESMGDSAAII
jgi:hypothetical protein